MQKNTEQMKLENDQIEVIVNYHGAELRSLKKKATDQEYLWNADAILGTYITGIISICRRSKE
jgi:galactose mutarotase-like enzyme